MGAVILNVSKKIDLKIWWRGKNVNRKYDLLSLGSNLQRIIDGEGSFPPIAVIAVVILLLPLFLYEGYLLMDASQKIEVEDVFVGDYTTEIEEGTENITRIEFDLNINITNNAATSVKIERLEYDLVIEPDDIEQEDIEFDSGEVYHKIIQGGTVTTISIPVENEDEDDIEKIQDYLLEEEGKIEAVTEIHVPLLQIVVDFPVHVVSEQLRETFEYQPVLEDYDVDDQNATLEKADETDDADHFLKIPYLIETNENEFVSGEVNIETKMESSDGEITSSDSITLEIGENKEGNFTFGLYEDDTEELLTNEQNIEFSSDITLEEDISFEGYHDRSIESPAMLEEFEVDEDNATLEEAEDDNSDYVLKTPYEIRTNDNEFISGMVEINTTMTDYANITSTDHIEFEIGEDKDGYLRFGLDEDDIEELLTEEQTIEFYSDITSSKGDVSFECEHDSVHSQAMLVEYEIEGDDADLDEYDEHLKIPYYIETQETAFFEEGGIISVTTYMTSEEPLHITSNASFEIEIGETEDGVLIFELDDDEVEELLKEDKTLQFVSDVERNDISFEYDHEEEGEWIAPN